MLLPQEAQQGSRRCSAVSTSIQRDVESTLIQHHVNVASALGTINTEIYPFTLKSARSSKLLTHKRESVMSIMYTFPP